jgi:branched-chain amino acid transport system ATP-binding protein|tara:strand:+ start:3514 stop:4248 length:735 start_codon:yes stop_codon:yes gene_type:complete
MKLLEINKVSKNFGVLCALDDVSVSVKANTFHGLIGPNGSGKSTLLSIIAGAHYADNGSVVFDQNDITKTSPEIRARKGLSLKFQITAILPELSTYDNLLLSVQSSQSIWKLISSKSKGLLHDEIMNVLERFKLADRADTLAGELSHGLQQWLEIAMAVIRKPKLLLLDEPTGGMSPEERRATGELLLPIKKTCTLIIVEHDLDFIKDICDNLTVLDQGKIIDTGTVEEIKLSKKVQEVYTTRV